MKEKHKPQSVRHNYFMIKLNTLNFSYFYFIFINLWSTFQIQITLKKTVIVNDSRACNAI
jgi:hypothetical protein